MRKRLKLRRKRLVSKIRAKRATIKILKKRSDTSEDMKELEEISQLLEDIQEEILDVEEQIEILDEEIADESTDETTDEERNAEDEEEEKALEEEERNSEEEEIIEEDEEEEEARSLRRRRKRKNTRSFNPVASYRSANRKNVTRSKDGDVYRTLEYRKAFAKYVQTGEWNFRERTPGAVTSLDIGKLIPQTIMDELIKKLKVYGQLYNRVRKTNIQGGVEFPISDLIPTVRWISETVPSDDQKAPEINTSVVFGYHIAEARISQTLLASIVSLPVLETEIATLLAEAFIREYDRMIVAGTGVGQPLGVTKDTRIPVTNIITFTDEEMKDWKTWRKKLFAKVPLAYRGQGVLTMTVATWESDIMTLTDDNNNPVYSQTYNPEIGEEEGRFNGREVILVEPDILADFDTATVGDVFAIYLRPTDYAINSNLQIGFKRYFDEEMNKWVNKGLTICDGKALDTAGIFILKKGAGGGARAIVKK